MLAAKCTSCGKPFELAAADWVFDDECKCPHCGVRLAFQPLRVQASHRHADAAKAREDVDARLERLRTKVGAGFAIAQETTPRWTEIVLSGGGARLRLRIAEAEWVLSGQLDARHAENLIAALEDVFPELHSLGDRPGPGAQPWRA